MSEQKQPVVFTAEEQVQLRQLEENGRKLNNLSLLLKRGLFVGENSYAVIESIAFVEGFIQQTQQQGQQIQKNAEARSAEQK